MIDWDKTKELFGFTSASDLTMKRPKVVCKCDGCGKERVITIRVKSRIVNNHLDWLCPACVSSGRSDEISKQLKKLWADPEYRSERSNFSKSLFDDDAYRKKHSDGVKNAMVNVDMSSILLERYANPDARQKIREISIKNWENQDFKDKHLKSMRSDRVRSMIGARTRVLWTDDEYRSKMAVARANQLGKISKIQEMLYSILDDLGVNYYKEGEDTKIGYYVFDCYIKSNKLLIECHGDYWHSLQKAQVRDKQKFTYINKYFPDHRLVYFWEREFYEYDRVLSRLRSLLNIGQVHIDFSFADVVVKKVDKVKYFLDLYHYIGPGRGGIKIGAFLDDVLIALAVFSSPVRQNLNFPSGSLELSRFCIHPSYHKKNFASWFLSRCVKSLPHVVLFSYADSTVGHSGTIYKAAGWVLDHEVNPDYWYMDIDGYVMHKKTLYNRAANLKLSESEFAVKYGYQKIVGGPKYCYTYQR